MAKFTREGPSPSQWASQESENAYSLAFVEHHVKDNYQPNQINQGLNNVWPPPGQPQLSLIRMWDGLIQWHLDKENLDFL